jgi:hypothetical protein
MKLEAQDNQDSKGSWNFPFWGCLIEHIEKGNSESLLDVCKILRILERKEPDLYLEKKKGNFNT